MKVLIVCSGNRSNFDFKIHQSFIYEQIESLKQNFNFEYDTFLIMGRGITGYLKNLPKLRRKIIEYSPDIIHAHYGLSGLIAVMQKSVPVVITFHGSDAYTPNIRILSMIAARLSRYNIFVGDKIKNKIKGYKEYSIVPCGVDLKIFYPVDRDIARKNLNLDLEKKYILFSSGFDNPVKNYHLAISAIKILRMNIELIELKNRTRDEVNLFLNASDLLLLTSISEGSPQIIKEAMACNCPIVTTDVGDIKEVIDKIKGCYLTSFNSEDVANKIKLAIGFNQKTKGREKIKLYDNVIIAEKIYQIYKEIIKKHNYYR